MSRAHVRLKSLLKEADLDEEEGLVILWDAGIESVTAPADFIPRASLSRARRTLGLHPGGPSKESHVTGPTPPPAVVMDAKRQEPDRFEWRTVGSPSQIEYLTVKEVEAVHSALVRDFARSNDPISPPGIRDQNLFGLGPLSPPYIARRHP
jgi:hypothetical protein